MKPARLLAVLTLALAFAGCAETAETADTASPETKSEAAAKPEPPDTGRLSGGEYDTLKRSTTKFNMEAGEFGDGIGKCGVIASAGQLAEASSCIGDAFDGWDGAAALAYADYTDLIDASAKKCRTSLRRLRKTMDAYYSISEGLKKQAENLQLDGETAELLAPEVKKRRGAFNSRRGDAYSRCAPK